MPKFRANEKKSQHLSKVMTSGIRGLPPIEALIRQIQDSCCGSSLIKWTSKVTKKSRKRALSDLNLRLCSHRWIPTRVRVSSVPDALERVGGETVFQGPNVLMLRLSS